MTYLPSRQSFFSSAQPWGAGFGLAGLLLALALPASADSTLTRSTLAAGGGVSADVGSQYSLTGTIQPLASGPQVGDPYLVEGGFDSGYNLNPLIISEFRFRGPNGAADEYVEIYNASEDLVRVGTVDNSAGWDLVGSDGAARFTIPNGTAIPARGHFLGVNTNGYSMEGIAAHDAVFNTNIADGGGIALFRADQAGDYTLQNRLDAVGYSGVDSMYREGVGLAPTGLEISNDLQYAFYRNLSNELPQISDVPDNVEDFRGVVPTGETLSTTSHPGDPGNPSRIGKRLGVPGPENLASPIQVNDVIQVSAVDSSAGLSDPPNRIVDYGDTTADDAAFGTVTLRRKITNVGTQDITSLQLRIMNVTTFPSPAGTSDVRAITVGPTTITVAGNPVDILGTSLAAPSSVAQGGGYNSVLTVAGIDAGHPFHPGAVNSLYLQVKLGLEQSGSLFRFGANFEGLP